MKFNFKLCLIIISLAAILFSACSIVKPKKTKYCGSELTEKEVIRLKEKGESFSYSDEDIDLLADISNEVLALYFDTVITEVFLFMHDKDDIGIYLVGQEDPKEIEKISCHLLRNLHGINLPKNVYLLFYSDENEKLVAAVRN